MGSCSNQKLTSPSASYTRREPTSVGAGTGPRGDAGQAVRPRMCWDDGPVRRKLSKASLRKCPALRSHAASRNTATHAREECHAPTTAPPHSSC
jgi:hypothetical protein